MQVLMAPVLKETAARPSSKSGLENQSDLIHWAIKESDGKAWDPVIQVEYQAELGMSP